MTYSTCYIVMMVCLYELVQNYYDKCIYFVIVMEYDDSIYAQVLQLCTWDYYDGCILSFALNELILVCQKNKKIYDDIM